MDQGIATYDIFGNEANVMRESSGLVHFDDGWFAQNPEPRLASTAFDYGKIINNLQNVREAGILSDDMGTAILGFPKALDTISYSKHHRHKQYQLWLGH